MKTNNHRKREKKCFPEGIEDLQISNLAWSTAFGFTKKGKLKQKSQKEET